MENIIDIIDKEIFAARDDVVSDTVKFVAIDSTKGDPVPGGPFGEGPKKMLEAVMEYGESDGFFPKDYKVGVASISMKEGVPDLGIWIHGDVMPVGNRWIYEPFKAFEMDGCIIGRGAGDNKGQFSAMYNLLKIFKKLGIHLKYNPAIYVGSDEENGLHDLLGDKRIPEAKGFLNTETPPRISLVPDGSYPVCYGGKGKATFFLKSRTPFKRFTLCAGRKDAPWEAVAEFDSSVNVPEDLEDCKVERGERIIVSSQSQARHGASPDPKGNMITKLSKALLDAGLVPEENIAVVNAFRTITSDLCGKALGLDAPHPIMGTATVNAPRIYNKDGYPELEVGVRYHIGTSFEEMKNKVLEYAERNGLELTFSEDTTPAYIMDKEAPVLKDICSIVNSVMGTNANPYLMAGITYAHALPNAYTCGTAANIAPKGFPEGHGGVHGPDESVSIDRLLLAMRIYARILLYLNETEW